MACGIFLDQGSNLCPKHWQVDSRPLAHQGRLKHVANAPGCVSFRPATE